MSFTYVVGTKYGEMLVPSGDAPRGRLLCDTGVADDDAEIQLLCGILRDRSPEAVAVDVGANIGCFTLAFAAAATTVHAFEPQRMLYYMLCGSIALNGATHVVAHHAALGNVTGFIDMPVYNYGVAGDFGCAEVYRTSGPQVGQPPRHMEKVACARLDSYRFDRVDVLKIDVEGMEEQVLRGAAETIRRYRPVMLVEWHKSHRATLEALLDGWNYEVEIRSRDLLALPR